MAELVVALGPTAELHSGIHGSLLEAPPAGVRYVLPRHTHRFLAGENPVDGVFDPFCAFSLAETVDYELACTGAVGVHSSRVAVGGAYAWIADADCLLSTLRYGRSLIYGAEARIRAGEIKEAWIRSRARLMAAQYADRRCRGVLFRSQHARGEALRYITDDGLLRGAALDRFTSKLGVMRPTLPFQGGRRPGVEPAAIVYMGRSAPDKGAAIAEQVFGGLLNEFGDRIRLTWIGPASKAFARHHRGIVFHSLLGRADYMALLDCGDIFFSPSEFESYGMGLVEAACRGMAIVTSCGHGMEHIREMFTDGVSAALIDNGLPLAERVAAYLQAMRAMLAERSVLASLQRGAADTVVRGCLSISSRDSVLHKHYDEMQRSTPARMWTAERHALERFARQAGLATHAVPADELARQYSRASSAGSRRVRLTT